MKRKTVEKLIPTGTRKSGLVVTVQTVKDILILNIYKDKKLGYRYCMNTKNYEYQLWDAETETWSYNRLVYACDSNIHYWRSYYNLQNRLKFNSNAEEELVKEKLGMENCRYAKSAVGLIESREDEYSCEKKERTENNRITRINNLMSKVPELPADIRTWIYEKATGAADFIFFDKVNKKWECTNCSCTCEEGLLIRTDGEKARHNDMVICPECGKTVQAKKRTYKQEVKTHFMLLQPVDSTCSVARHFDVNIYWGSGGRKVTLNEAVRIVIYKMSCNPNYACQIYYNQYSTSGAYCSGMLNQEYAFFDNKSNPAHRKEFSGWLYPKRIEESLEDTAYKTWVRVFKQMAEAGIKVNYNRLMATQNNRKLAALTELLFKGRFNRLLEESVEGISCWSRDYTGPLGKNGKDIEDVFGIKDRQKINRIRDLDGGERMVFWMRWSERTGEKISGEVLDWLIKNDIECSKVKFIEKYMHIGQIMNYVKRQQAEEYKGKSALQILSQWADYMRMCEKLKKHTDDEMVYRPRELKRRHDEAVAEVAIMDAQLKADEFSRRFPGAEEILSEIKHKYEYSNDTYMIVVPDRLVDIVADGRVLHHCAGSSDRYFDRIKQRETYICFLRKAAEPDVPYYTIEVEPGGTIRQHRGYLDEEPDIELIKPFLREWQRELKKRLSAEDQEYAKISAIKREENLEELRAKNNTRVLEGLMEDFMEAM